MFETISGSFTTFDQTGITDSTLALGIDELKNRKILAGGTSYTITSNTATQILFANNIAIAGTYSISFIDRAFLMKYEDELVGAVKFPDSLLTSKIATTSEHLRTKIKAYFRNLYNEFTDIDPLTLIINLYEVQTAFVYYCLAEIYGDTMLIQEDVNAFKESKYRKKYAEIVDDSISMLAVDRTQKGSLSNDDLAKNVGKGFIMTR